MGLLGKRLKVPRENTVAAHIKRKRAARENRPYRSKVIPVWWISGYCSDDHCVDERLQRQRKSGHAQTEFLCQICRLCKAHCLGHRGILDGHRAFLTVHHYD